MLIATAKDYWACSFVFFGTCFENIQSLVPWSKSEIETKFVILYATECIYNSNSYPAHLLFSYFHLKVSNPFCAILCKVN